MAEQCQLVRSQGELAGGYSRAFVPKPIETNASVGLPLARQLTAIAYCRAFLPKSSFHFAFVAAGTFRSASSNHETVESEFITTEAATKTTKQNPRNGKNSATYRCASPMKDKIMRHSKKRAAAIARFAQSKPPGRSNWAMPTAAPSTIQDEHHNSEE